MSVANQYGFDDMQKPPFRTCKYVPTTDPLRYWNGPICIPQIASKQIFCTFDVWSMGGTLLGPVEGELPDTKEAAGIVDVLTWPCSNNR
jgi:hypothetical protein